MFPIDNCSLLNEKIQAFYRHEIEGGASENASKYFHDDGTFRSKDVVGRVFPHKQNMNELIEDLNSYTYNEFLKCYEKLYPILQHSTSILGAIKIYKALNYEWMGRNSQVYKAIYSEMASDHVTKTVEHILGLTSLLENALANIYYTETQGRQPPHLLKDLLTTTEVRNVFGGELIVLLKILMGSPNSINIRNVVWHGFPNPLEIPVYYESTLLIIIHSLGCKINSIQYNITERPLVIDLTQKLSGINNEVKTEITNISEYEENVKSIKSHFAMEYVPYWLQLFSHYKSKSYIQLVILILPQIELLLRLHYGHVNQFDVSAKLDEYYITMDTIFETEIMTPKATDNNKRENGNKLLDFLTYPYHEGCFHLMYDIFLSPNGCRLRDKVSHGEVALTQLDNPELAAVVLQIFLNLLTPLKCHTLKSYESKLHLSCSTKNQLLTTYQNLRDFSLTHNTDKLNETLGNSPSKVLIFQRPKKESELVLLIHKISLNINQTINNYKESIQIRSALLAQRDLHSKRRKTLEKLQTTLPEITKTLHLMWYSVNKVFSLMQSHYNLVLDDDVKCNKTLRYLKHSLTISENFSKYAHCDSNEWIKSLELCRRYHEFHSKLFLYD